MADATPVPKIGAFVLETLTTGMYTNPLDTLREYVQNSFDSIREAENSGLLARAAGRIEISIDPQKRTLRLRDNGAGIPGAWAFPRLANIGMSEKSIDTSVGFRGIGRLAGIAYCERLSFKTQFSGERELSSISFDNIGLLKAMSPSMRQVDELLDVVARNTSREIQKTKTDAHFFEVLMENINPKGDVFLKWPEIRTYLSQTAPIGFDTQSFLLAGEIFNWLKAHRIELPTVNLTISYGSTNIEVFKPYQKLTYKTKREHNKIHVKGINFFPEDAGPDSPFWVWYAQTNLPGMFDDDTVSGLRLRKGNIGLGMAERMAEIFALAAKDNSRFNHYLMGEVHVQDSSVIPNARRDGFEDGLEWSNIRLELLEFARARSKEIRGVSNFRNMDIEKLLKPAQCELLASEKKVQTGFASKDERNSFVDKLNKQIEKLEIAKNSERSDEEVSRIGSIRNELTSKKEVIEKQSKYTAQTLNTSLDKKQRRIIAEIIEILYEVLPEAEFEKTRDAIMRKYQAHEEKKAS
ncbi:MAG: hypothetical protein ACLPN1_08245 [Dissulfurispiraceae bacterium]